MIAEEESGLLLRKAADLEKEILRLNLVMSEVRMTIFSINHGLNSHEMMYVEEYMLVHIAMK